ncbi:MAG: hypothetical protein KC503_15055, partial [Myxococcales bacterium]|nr:hypothetical protein [Myxococcales bacterium]
MRGGAWMLACALLATLPACEGTKVTQIVVSVATDLSIPGEIDQLSFLAGYRDSSVSAVDVTWDLDANRPDAIVIPARIAVLPSSSSTAARVVQLEVRGLSAGKLVVARRAALPFARDRALLLGMNLLRRCVPVRCEPDESCGEGGCEKVDKNPDDVPDWTEGNERKSQDARAGDGFNTPADGRTSDGDGPDGDGPARDGPRADANRDADAGADGD